MLTLVDETDPILTSQVNQLFDFSNPCTSPDDLENFMIDVMLQNNGFGLAAPQIGLSYRVFVMEGNKAAAYFNPTIIKQSEDICIYEEGCLSFPGLYIKIKRPASIVAEYQDANGNCHRKSFHGFEARCFSHELDHLNGVVFTSRAGKTSLSLAKSRRRKHLRRMTK